MQHDSTPTDAGASARASHPHLLIAALALGGFAIGTSEFATMSVLPSMAHDFGVDAPAAGHLISAYALGVVVGAPLLAVLGARWPRRRLLVALMLAYLAAHAAGAMADSLATLALARFAAGLPHGAYFGVAALVAAAQVSPARRTQAMSYVMLGLTLATVVGVPLSEWLSQHAGWRPLLGIVAALALATALGVARLAPADRPDPTASPMRELAALREPRVWVALATGAIGFAGIFGVYTYLANTLAEVTKVSPATVPWVFLVFGLGLTVGNLVAARLADRALMATGAGVLALSAVSLALFPLAAGRIEWLLPLLFVIAQTGGLGVVLQARIMDVAGEAQTLAAAMHHSAFNTANALGPWLAGMALSAGWGWGSTGLVGAAMALAGLAIHLASWAEDQRRTKAGTASPAAIRSPAPG